MIHPDNTWALWAVIICGTAASIWLEQTYRWAAKLSGPVVALGMAMILSNVGIMPAQAPSYDFVGDYLIPLAIPLLLLRANLFRIARETGWMFVAFHISTLGTILGALLATYLLRGYVENIPAVAGIMTASYVGGSVNFFAVKETFHISANLTNPLLVADNFIMASMFLLLLSLASSQWIRRYFRTPHSQPVGQEQAPGEASDHWRRKEISLLDIAKSLAIAFAVAAVSTQLSSAIQKSLPPSFLTAMIGNLFVHLTFFSLLVATLFPKAVEKVHGAGEMGSYLLYVFLFCIGLPADLWAVVKNVPILFLFCLIIAVTNLVVTLALGKLLRIDLEELLLSVNATLGGAPSAAAMAVSKNWSALVLPGILMGVWGYVIGTFLGVFVGELLMRWM